MAIGLFLLMAAVAVVIIYTHTKIFLNYKKHVFFKQKKKSPTTLKYLELIKLCVESIYGVGPDALTG